MPEVCYTYSHRRVLEPRRRHTSSACVVCAPVGTRAPSAGEGPGYDTPQWGSVAGDGFLQVRRGSRGEIWVPETTE